MRDLLIVLFAHDEKCRVQMTNRHSAKAAHVDVHYACDVILVISDIQKRILPRLSTRGCRGAAWLA